MPLHGFEGFAYNQASASENQIHSDDVARAYGFRGGLVPGVTTYAYLAHPALQGFGLAWLERGTARVRLAKPLYDGLGFHVELEIEEGGRAYTGRVLDAQGEVCAPGRIALPDSSLAKPPERRGDPPVGSPEARPEATRAALERLRETGMGALTFEWNGRAELAHYLRDPEAMPDLVRPDREGYANPAVLLGLANSILSANVRLGPWIHVESDVAHASAVPPGSKLLVEGRIVDLFERRGHEFVELEVGVFLAPDRPALAIRHRAIYRLRPPGGA